MEMESKSKDSLMAANVLYHQTNKIVQETQNCFAELENYVEDDAELLEKQIQVKIDTITSNCEKLDLLVHKIPITKRQTSKSRVDQLKYDNQHLQAALRVLQHKRKIKQTEMREREELLQRKFETLKNEEETAIFIDHSIQHQNALQRTNRNLDDLILTGKGVLENLKEQRITLKGAHRRLIDMANTLGLSNTTMRLIENRVKEDKWILLGGMFLTMLIVCVVIFYIKK